MIQEFAMPKSGHLMEEGTVVSWRKKVGEAIKKGEILLDVEAEKGVFEAECPYTGVVKEILVPEQTTVAVGTLLAKIDVAE
jgi:pyruvate/2-oxoglutarate dehydrogenase complex dihydrolipoamide acyltransferase (E2) component